MKCRACGDEMVTRDVDVCYCSSGRIVTGVPALECDTCGERVYRPEIAEALESMRSHPGTPFSTRMFRVFSFVSPPRPAQRDEGAVSSSETADLVIQYDKSPTTVVVHEREAVAT